MDLSDRSQEHSAEEDSDPVHSDPHPERLRWETQGIQAVHTCHWGENVKLDYVYLIRNYFQCIPSDLFCDGTVNCALLTGKPLGRDWEFAFYIFAIKKYVLDEINCTTKITPNSEKGLTLQTVTRSLIENFPATSTVFIMLGILFGKFSNLINMKQKQIVMSSDLFFS